MTEAGFKDAPRPVTVTLEVVRHAVDADGVPAPDCEFALVIRAGPR
jgi:hypothetical protein